MAAIEFRDVNGAPLDRGLGKLLEPLVGEGGRAVVLCGSEERLRALDAGLWTYDPASFLPHASAAEGQPERHPVWLTLREENPNGAGLLVLVEAEPAGFELFARYAFLFDKRDPAARDAARERWRRLRDAGHGLVYWELGSEGWRRQG